jgi:uncharacterized repeat protein (TIGR03803 family)
LFVHAATNEVNGLLFGVTCCGGAYGFGNIFTISTSGAVRVNIFETLRSII